MTASLLEQLADLPKAEADALIRAMAPGAAAALNTIGAIEPGPNNCHPEDPGGYGC